MLLQIYGAMLTEKQYGLLDDYYNNDLSLSEIAENYDITRQAVRDIIKKGENKLFELEEKLSVMNNAFQALEINREDVYIANIVKCRPPSNRVPEDDEVQTCLNYLRNQVILIKPKIIVLLGSTALKNILGKEYGITAVRGNWMEKNGIKYMPTWHPAALLRDENKKIEFWQDLKEVKKYIDNNIDWEGKN